LTRGLNRLADERVSEGEQHGDTNADQECSVDQASQQEHFGLQSIHQLGLTSRSFEVFTTHQSNTDTGAECTQSNNKNASQSNESNVGHNNSLVKNLVIKKSKRKLLCKNTLRPGRDDCHLEPEFDQWSS